MRTDIALWAILVLIAVGGALFFILKGNLPLNGEIRSASVLSADKLLHDFGEVNIYEGKVVAEFFLSSEGVDDVVITNGTTSCGCTRAEVDEVSFGMHERMRRAVIVPAGETKKMVVIFDPLAHGPSGVGLIERSVLLKTNSNVTRELEIRIKALVTNND